MSYHTHTVLYPFVKFSLSRPSYESIKNIPPEKLDLTQLMTTGNVQLRVTVITGVSLSFETWWPIRASDGQILVAQIKFRWPGLNSILQTVSIVYFYKRTHL